MRSIFVPACVMALLAAGCSQREVTPETQVEKLAFHVPESDAAASEAAPVNHFGFQEALEQPAIFRNTSDSARAALPIMEAPAAAADATPVPSGPQIAYSYDYGFRVDADEVDELQKRHVALCDAMGPECHILTRAKSGNEDYGYGKVELEVVAGKARAFGDKLSAATNGLDAERISYGVRGDDLAKHITDTQAHLASQQLLRKRLMEILATRKGSVGDLVEAEKAVAEVNEEIDSATSSLADMRGRVSYSSIDIEYDPTLGEYTLGFFPPIRYAITTVGTTLGVTIAAIIYVAIALVPITAFLLLLRWLWRKSGLRLRRRKNEPPA